MLDVEFHIAHEVDNSINSFFYKPLDLKTNLLTVRVLNGEELNSNKKYVFYLSIDGVNFALIGKPLKRLNENDWLFLIEESKIELRRYPRLNTEILDIKVCVNQLLGKLLDISLGGCKIGFDFSLKDEILPKNVLGKKWLHFYLPDNTVTKVLARTVYLNLSKNTMAFAFLDSHDKVLKLYLKIWNFLKEINNSQTKAEKNVNKADKNTAENNISKSS